MSKFQNNIQLINQLNESVPIGVKNGTKLQRINDICKYIQTFL